MHFDAHVAFKISKSGQYIGDMFCVVPGLIVAKKVKFFTTRTKAFHASSPTSFIEFLNSDGHGFEDYQR